MTTAPVLTTWVRVCPLAALIPERGVAALVGGEAVAVFLLEDGSVHAVGHHDPYSGANVMARGIVGSVSTPAQPDAQTEAQHDAVPDLGPAQRDTVASPMYKQVFDLRTGACLSEPGPGLPVHPVRVVEGHVEVGTRP